MTTLAAPLPADEARRLIALEALNILDSSAEPEFDAVVRHARTAFGVETALIPLIDADRQWFKAREGMDRSQTGRDIAFCAHAILQKEPFVVLNASVDPRFATNPLVTGAPRIRFYAGAPLILPGGAAVGTVCLIDPEPRYRFDPGQVAMLKFFAEITVERLLARARANEAVGTAA